MTDDMVRRVLGDPGFDADVAPHALLEAVHAREGRLLRRRRAARLAAVIVAVALVLSGAAVLTLRPQPPALPADQPSMTTTAPLTPDPSAATPSAIGPPTSSTAPPAVAPLPLGPPALAPRSPASPSQAPPGAAPAGGDSRPPTASLAPAPTAGP